MPAARTEICQFEKQGRSKLLLNPEGPLLDVRSRIIRIDPYRGIRVCGDCGREWVNIKLDRVGTHSRKGLGIPERRVGCKHIVAVERSCLVIEYTEAATNHSL